MDRLIARNFLESTIFVLLATLVALVVLLAQMSHRSSQAITARAVSSAATLSQIMELANAQYNESISNLVRGGQMRFVLNLEGHPDGLHPPATFSRRLSERISSTQDDLRIRIYSDHPIPGSEGRVLDAFARDAIARLTADPGLPYVVVGKAEGGRVSVRHASALVMKEQCLQCHNGGDWVSQKSDWKVGDVRGVREIALVFSDSTLIPPRVFGTAIALLVTALAISAFALLPGLRKEVSRREAMTDEAERQRHLALTDVLTGVSNRRHYDEYLAGLATHERRRFGIIMLDIDHFKALNDRFGHAIGDDVLSEVGAVLRSTRGSDMVFRVGGEEFAIVSIGGSSRTLLATAERLRTAIAARQFQTGGQRISLTVSAGVALAREGETPEQCAHRADELLYQAKRNGRDCVVSQLVISTPVDLAV